MHICVQGWNGILLLHANDTDIKASNKKECNVSRYFKSRLQKHGILLVALLFGNFEVLEMVACNLVKQLNKLTTY